MTWSMVVSSRSGNTQQVADAVVEALRAQEGEPVFAGALPAEGTPDEARALDADLVFVGFWTDKGDCAPEMATFLSKLSGRRVFLFGTAGFGGADAYFQQILGRVRTHLPEDAQYAGGVMCQGRMGEGVRKRYEALLADNPQDARAQAMIENFDRALAHPDAEDCARIARAACDIVG